MEVTRIRNIIESGQKWYDKACKDKKVQARAALRRLRRHHTQEAEQEYLKLRNEYKELCTMKKSEEENREMEELIQLIDTIKHNS